MNVPICIFIGVQQGDRQDSQNLNNDFFCWLPVTSAQCIMGTKKYPDSSILLKYNDDDDYSQVYGQIEEAFRAVTKDDILQAYMSNTDVRSSNVRVDDVGSRLYVFDKRYQQNFTASQPVKVEFQLNGNIPDDTNGYALLLTNKLFSIVSDGQKQFDLI